MKTTLKRINDIDENVLDDIKRLIKNFKNFNNYFKQKKKKKKNRNAKNEKKELKRKCLLLNNILTAVTRRPLPTPEGYKDSNSPATKSRAILRRDI